jgi:hypothetical protein
MKTTQTTPTTSVRLDEATRARLERIVEKHPPINATQIITVALREYLDKAEATGVISIGSTPNPTSPQDKAMLTAALTKAHALLENKKAQR